MKTVGWPGFSWCLVLGGLFWGQVVGAGTLIGLESEWSYWLGRDLPPGDEGAWTQEAYDDSSWLRGLAPFRYGDGRGGTVITDMRSNYSTVFLRRTFRVSSVELVEALQLKMDYDDGFVVWVNGSEVLRVNAPRDLALGGFAPQGHESGRVESFSLEEGRRQLVEGTNVIAIQGFNINLTSSDFMLHPALEFQGLDRDPPRVLSIDPPAGLVRSFSEVVVTFSEPVSGVDAGDLTVNDVAAWSVRKEGNRYLFSFPAVGPGDLTLQWRQDAGIGDLAARPNGLEATTLSEIRQYHLVDADAPFVTTLWPSPRQSLMSLSVVSVTFSEPVRNVDPEDLTLDGRPARSVAGSGAGPFEFLFDEVISGPAELAWSETQDIVDYADEPNRLQTLAWNYQVDPTTTRSGVVISEIMAGNRSGLRDEEGERVDWIELFNERDQAVSLEGWSLTDDRSVPDKWVFGDVEIKARSRLIVYASSKDRPSPRQGFRPHTNFRLSLGGEYLGLFGPELPRRVVSEWGLGYPQQRNDHSYGLLPEGGLGYFEKPTPGNPNAGQAVADILPPPFFSARQGFYDRALDLVLSSSVEGAVVRYTLDKSEPTASSGIVYREPISISRTRIVRAAVFKRGSLPSETKTHSYLFRLSNARRSLPVLSLVTDRDNLFGPSGIMETSPRNTDNRGRAWERPVSCEFFLPEGQLGFQVDCGLRIQGGDYIRARYDPNAGPPAGKYSFRLYFRGDYGPASLSYPLIPRSPAEEYKQIVLRAGMNDHSNPFVVDELVRRLSADMGQVSSQGTLVVLYLNGVYEGYYNPTERIDEDFLRSWQGGDDDYDIIAQFGEVRSGSAVEWNRMKQVLNRDLTVPANYDAAREVLDFDNFIDYLILNIYVGTRDWPHNNWRAARERVAGARWRFYVWDAEWSFFNQGGSVGHNTLAAELGTDTDIARIYRSLAANPTFRTRFADRVHRHFFEDGALTDENVSRHFEQLRNDMSGVLRNMQTTIASSWIPRRRDVVFDHLRAAGLYLPENVPQFSQDPGSVQVGALELSGAGEIYYTLDGTDPLVPGGTSTAMTELVGERALKEVIVPQDGNQGTRWRRLVEDFDSSQWQRGRGGVGYDEAATYRSHIGLDVGEAMNDKQTSVFVRIPFQITREQLVGRNSLILGVKFDDGFVAYLNGRRVAEANAPERVSWDSAASGGNPDSSAVHFQSFNISSEFEGLREGFNLLALHGLNSSLTSSDFLLDVQLTAGFTDQGKVSEGALHYEEPISIIAATRVRARSLLDGEWSAVREGTFYPGSLVSDLRFSEIMYHPSGGEEYEFLEVTNFGPIPLDLSGFKLSGVSYVFPIGSMIDPGVSWVLVSNDNPSAFSRRYPNVSVAGTFGGSLSNAGEAIGLLNASGGYITGTVYADDGLWPVRSDGEGNSLELLGPGLASELPANWMASVENGGSPGEYRPRELSSPVVISEVLAYEGGTESDGARQISDWVEIENRSGALHSLAGYQLRDENNERPLVFGEQVVLEPGERMVIHRDSVGRNEPTLPFGLDRDGDSVVLVDPIGAIVDGVTFGPQVAGYSLIRAEAGSWRLGLPSPGESNRMAETAPWEALRINEVFANPSSGERDWIELSNLDPERPLALFGLHVEVEGHQVAYSVPGFLPASGYGLLLADKDHDVRAVPVRLPAEGAALALVTPSGVTIDRVVYASLEEDSSFGRLPNGTGSFRVFPTGTSPGAENVSRGPSLVRLNEFMARNRGVRYTGIEGVLDWIELLNEDSKRQGLGGWSIRLNGGRKRVLPLGTFIEPGGFLLLWCDGNGFVERSDQPNLNLGARLDGDGGRIELLDAMGVVMDRIDYGPQIADESIGLVGEDWVLLSTPSPGQVNGRARSVGAPDLLRLNEWWSGGDDWLELYHPGELPVALGGLFLSDDPSKAGEMLHEIGPLSFIAPGGWAVFQADGHPERGADHLSFSLHSQGETVTLYGADGVLIDEISLAASEPGTTSTGRLPDGDDRLVGFDIGESSPGKPNRTMIEGLRINEVLAAGQDGEGAIELWNDFDSELDLSGWHLGWSHWPARMYTLPEGTTIQAGSFQVIPEFAWAGVEIADRTVPRLIDASGILLSETDHRGQPTGRRIEFPLVKAVAGQSVGVIESSIRRPVTRLREPSLGVRGGGVVVSGHENGPPWLGPVVISEIVFDADLGRDGTSGPASDLEYLELTNRSSEPVVLADPDRLEIGWRLTGGVHYVFRRAVTLNSGRSLIVVNFDPEQDDERRAQLRERFGAGDDVLVLGPFEGKLRNEGEEIFLQQIQRIPSSFGGLEGVLAWLTEDEVDFRGPIDETNLGGEVAWALTRRMIGSFGGDSTNWQFLAASPGRTSQSVELPNPGRASIVGFRVTARGVELDIALPASGEYRVEYRKTLNSGQWLPLWSGRAESSQVQVRDLVIGVEQRFYRAVSD